MIEFYNSLTRKKEEFVSIEKNKVKMYSCGPTVYNFAHIGNLRAYVFADVLKRVLEYFNYKVTHVMNITDVDDKTIKGSKDKINENSNPNEILKKFTEEYTKYFYEDIEDLNIIKPTFFPKATESIKEMEFLINRLYSKGFAYVSDDGIYFDLSKAKNYGKLVEVDFKYQKRNVCNRMINDEYDKDSIQDFVLWKFKNEENEPSWKIKVDNKEYVGRPGWHIECSAMSMKYLGEVFDIHTGGIDNKFPHHENEICQSSHALDIENQANYWLHNEHLLVDGKKMSKSLGNFYTLRDLKDKNFNPLSLREVYLRAHYRQQLNFTFDSLKAGEVNIKKINDFYNTLKNLNPSETENDDIENNGIKNNRVFKLSREKLDLFEKAIKDDLNTPMALASVYEFIHGVNKFTNLTFEEIGMAIDFIKRVDKVLGLLDEDLIKINIPSEVIELAEKRKIARNEKNYTLADELRKEIELKGFIIKDDSKIKDGYIILKK